MFCRKCGKEIPDDSLFCSGCGERVVTSDIEETVAASPAVSLEKTAENVTYTTTSANAAADKQSASAVPPEITSQKCYSCGELVYNNQRSCHNCGAANPGYSSSFDDFENNALQYNNSSSTAAAVLPQKRNKLKVILISVGALVAVLAVVFFAVILPEMHLDFYYDRDPETGEYIILGTVNDVKEINIPDTIWFIPVRAIDNEAFKNSIVESVSFGKNIAEIGERSFESCTELKSVAFRTTYDNSDIYTISIGTSAFYNCSSLNNLTLPSINTVIGDGAFYKCRSLKKVYLGNVSSIGQIAFGESGLTSLEVDCNVGMAAFGKCTDLNTIQIYSWATLDSNVFEGCSNLKEATICTSTIPAYTFSMCSNLEKVYWNRTSYENAEIGNYAFVNCSSLSEIVTGDDLSIDNPKGITDYNSQIAIGEGVFDGCDNFKASQATSSSGTEQSDDRSENIVNYDAVYLADMTYNEFTSVFGLPEKGYYLGSIHYNKADVDVNGGMEGYDPYSNNQVAAVTVYGGKEITFCEDLHLGEHISYYDKLLNFDVYDSLQTGNLQGFIWYELGLLFTDGQTGRRYNVTVRFNKDTYISYAVKVSWAGGYGM